MPNTALQQITDVAQIIKQLIDHPCTATRLSRDQVMMIRERASNIEEETKVAFAPVGGGNVSCAQRMTTKVEGFDAMLRSHMIDPSLIGIYRPEWHGCRILVVNDYQIRRAIVLEGGRSVRVD